MKSILIVVWSLSSACTTGRPAGDGYLEGINDPAADDNAADQPPFCNISIVKPGADYEKCAAHNRALYQAFDDEAQKREPWFNFTPSGWAQSSEIPAQFVLPVAHDGAAIIALEAQPFLALQPADVRRYTGKSVQFDGKSPYLVRALYYYKQGSFHVFQKDRDILIQHDSTGPDMPNETRSAVVVFLAAAPRYVYVDCGLH